jgi:peptidoglycan hydrolase CwlO-like protein
MEGKSIAVGLLAGLIVAAVAGFAAYKLYQELNSTRLELSKTSEKLAACQADLQDARSLIQELEVNLTVCRDENSVLGAALAAANKTIETLSGQLKGLQESYDALKEAYGALEANYTKLMEDYNALLANHTRLQESYRNLNASYTQLKADYEALKEDYTRLSEDYEALNATYTSLKSDYEILSSQYELLNTTFNMLRSQYEKLKELHSSMQREYSEVTNALKGVLTWTGVFDSDEDMKAFYDMLLTTAAEQGKLFVDVVGFSGSLDYRALDVFSWTVRWLAYCPDSYVRVPNSSEGFRLEARNEVYMLPNETFLNGCGDCEDLALLVYAILKATQLPGEKIYLVEVWPTEGDGHTGVLVAYREGGETRYYVIDPAGNYFNGIALLLVMEVIDLNETKWFVTLTPLDISMDTKEFLLGEGLAWEVYYIRDTDNYTLEPPLYYYTSAFDALRDWIVGFLEYAGVSEIRIHDIGAHATFTSIVDAARWLEQNS